MDCSIQPTKIPGVCLVTTTDFFYPLVDSPYMQGGWVCASSAFKYALLASSWTNFNNLIFSLCCFRYLLASSPLPARAHSISLGSSFLYRHISWRSHRAIRGGMEISVKTLVGRT